MFALESAMASARMRCSIQLQFAQATGLCCYLCAQNGSLLHINLLSNCEHTCAVVLFQNHAFVRLSQLPQKVYAYLLWFLKLMLAVPVEQFQALPGLVAAGSGKPEVGADGEQRRAHCPIRPQDGGLQAQAHHVRWFPR